MKLLGAIDDRTLAVADRDQPDAVNISSDEPFLRSLDALGFISLEPRLKDHRSGPGVIVFPTMTTRVKGIDGTGCRTAGTAARDFPMHSTLTSTHAYCLRER